LRVIVRGEEHLFLRTGQVRVIQHDDQKGVFPIQTKPAEEQKGCKSDENGDERSKCVGLQIIGRNQKSDQRRNCMKVDIGRVIPAGRKESYAG